ncbi:MAG: hypothetical protein ACPGIC_00230 [Opitutales bacterium]
MKKLLAFAILSLMTSAGCMKDDVDLSDLAVPRLMVEARGVDYGSLTGKTVTLPVSGTKIALQKEPLVNEFDFVNAELVKVEMGLAVLLQLNDRGARSLYRGTVTNMGGRIVLTVNGNAIGARLVDGPIQDGNFYTFVEVDDDAVGQLVIDLKDSIQRLGEL